MTLDIRLGNKNDLAWGQATVTARHYLHQPVHRQARPIIYVISSQDRYLGLIMASLPHATKNGGWWGYDGLPTQWQVCDLSRVWLDPAIQLGGELSRPEIVPGFIDRKGIFRPTVATWAIGQVLDRIQVDWVSSWPPVYPSLPYHVLLVISYQDPAFHQRGIIYRQAGARPMYTDEAGEPTPGPSGKYGWHWRLPEPTWSWQDIHIRRPRTMRLQLFT